MLASLLPGLRDLRTPLATGYLWLIALWLLLHDRVPKSEDGAKGPIRSLFELGGLLGSTALLAALSFVAYLVGSMLLYNPQPNFSHVSPDKRDLSGIGQLSRFIANFPLYLVGIANMRSVFKQLETFTMTRLRETEVPLGVEAHKQILGEPVERLLYARDLVNKNNGESNESELVSAYRRQIMKDVPAIGIQLQAKNRDLWDTYDRHKSEAQFRFGITPPLTCIIVIVSLQARSLLWFLLICVPVYLFILGWRQSAQAILTLVQAVVLKMVEPPVLERLREYVARVGAKDQQAAEQRKAELERVHPRADKDLLGG